MQSLYALLRNTTDPSELEVEEAFDGNLCRCTGYRPILDAAQTFNKDQAFGKGATKASNVYGMRNSTSNSGTNGSAKNGSPNGSACCMQNGSESGGGCCMDKGSKATGGEPIKRFTPPGFIEYHPDTELIFPPALRKHEFRPLAFGNKRKRWFRPVTLQELLEIKSAYPSAKVIGGSTETQIEIKFKAMQYAASVYVGDIAELRQYSFKHDHLELGGNVNLTDLEEICQEAIERYGPVKGQPFEAIHKQIRYFVSQHPSCCTLVGSWASEGRSSNTGPGISNVLNLWFLPSRLVRRSCGADLTTFYAGWETNQKRRHSGWQSRYSISHFRPQPSVHGNECDADRYGTRQNN